LIKAGIPAAVPAFSVNKVCGSGLQAVMLAAQAIRAGDQQVVVAGGQESMSQTPVLCVRHAHRREVRRPDLRADGLIKDGLWCSFYGRHMGGHAEYTAHKAGISRQRQDEFALASHQKAVAAQQAGKFAAEIAPVVIPGKKGDTVMDTDESPRKPTRRWRCWPSCARLRQGCAVGHEAADQLSVTAGNAPGLNDGGRGGGGHEQAYAQAHGLPILGASPDTPAGGGDPRTCSSRPSSRCRT
jgi:acetyl-CoA C-acetyltransferase